MAQRRIRECNGLHLDLCDLNLTELPENLPKSLVMLWCWNNNLQSLPDKLPITLEVLCCHHNNLQSLPDNFPESLVELWCHNNQLPYEDLRGYRIFQFKRTLLLRTTPRR